MNQLSFGFSWIALVFGLAFLAMAVGLSLRQWRRSGARRFILFLEILRWTIVLLLFLTLMRPELIRRVKPSGRPEVAVLWDASRSMTTRDVVAGQEVKARADWIREQLEAKFWAPLENRYAVRVEEFSPMPTNAASVASPEEGTDLNTALEAAFSRSRNLRATVVLSDGDWNQGKSPIAAATRYQMAGVPVFSVAVGSERYLPDLDLSSVAAPAYGLMGEQVFIPFTIQSHLPREVNTTVSLKAGEMVVASKKVTIPARGQLQDAVLWYPQRDGTEKLTLQIPVEQDEIGANNNERSFELAVRREILKVLVVDSLPRWEYRFLRNALSRDPMVELKCVLLHPELKAGEGKDYLPAIPDTKEALAGYDVVFLGDVGIGDDELTREDAENLKGLVEQQGSGLVFIPGRRGRHATFKGTALETLCPVQLDEARPEGYATPTPSQLTLTRTGRGHLLTMLANSEDANALLWQILPGFNWCAGVEKAKPGAEVLGVHESIRNSWGKLPLLVTRPSGNGKVLFLGTDSAWRWRMGVEDLYHYRFWGQVVRWMSYQRHRAHDQGFRLSFGPDSPSEGETVFLNATVFDPSGLPLSDARVTAEITRPAGRVDQLTLQALPGGWGVYQGSFLPDKAGEYRVRLSCDQTARTLESKLVVRGVVREETGKPAQLETLREVAGITGGRVARTDELADFISQLAAMPEPEPQERRLRLWCHPGWGGLILGLLTVYWVGRKWAGLI